MDVSSLSEAASSRRPFRDNAGSCAEASVARRARIRALLSMRYM